MVNKFSHKGKPKKYPLPEKNQKKLFDNVTWILDGSSPEQNILSRGSILLQKYENSEILEYYLDFINMICINPKIIIISGVSHNEFIKHKRSLEYGIVENPLHRLTNSAENLRLGILSAGFSDHFFFIEKPVIPKIDFANQIAENKKSKILCHEDNNQKKIGIDKDIKYSFASNTKLSGFYYFSGPDLVKLRKKLIGPSFSKNKFAFEMLTDIKFKIIMEENVNTNEL